MADTPTPAQPGLVNADTVSTVLRYILKSAGAAVVTHGYLSSTQWEQAAGALASLGALVWGIYSAHQDAKAKSA